MRFTVTSLRLGALLLLGCLLAATALAADDWSLLWQNKFVEAKNAYQASLGRTPGDACALLGMATLSSWEDAPQAAVGYWQRYIQAAPDSWRAMAYWPTLVTQARDTGQWEALDRAAKAVLAAPNVVPQMRASARLVLAQSAQRQQQHAAAEAIWTQLGYLHAWNVIGPFENFSNSGYDKAYAPEKALDFGKHIREWTICN